MLTLHHLEQSRSFRILWALEELGLEYQIQFYKRLPNFAGPPELLAVHPLGKARLITVPWPISALRSGNSCTN
jgi:glutathione S-transferase